MTLKLKPLADRVVVEPTEQEEMTASGIYVPETAKEKPQQGKVLAVGPEVEVENEDGKIVGPQEGDLVIYAKYAGTTFKTRDGKEMLILRVDDILGVVEE